MVVERIGARVAAVAGVGLEHVRCTVVARQKLTQTRQKEIKITIKNEGNRNIKINLQK